MRVTKIVITTRRPRSILYLAILSLKEPPGGSRRGHLLVKSRQLKSRLQEDHAKGFLQFESGHKGSVSAGNLDCETICLNSELVLGLKYCSK